MGASTGGAMRQLGFSDARWLLPLPEFKVLWSVIVSDTVQMMDVLRRQQETTECFLHGKAVFKNVAFSITRWVARNINPDVSVTSAGLATTPVGRVFHGLWRGGLRRVPASVTDGDAGLFQPVSNGLPIDSELTSEARNGVSRRVKLTQLLDRHGKGGLMSLSPSQRIAMPPEAVIVSAAPSMRNGPLSTVSNRTKHLPPPAIIVAQVEKEVY